tara:strand:+ start:191 stop:448 length:258 start_codon:yes stop_codon:yes gene_type:complete
MVSVIIGHVPQGVGVVHFRGSSFVLPPTYEVSTVRRHMSCSESSPYGNLAWRAIWANHKEIKPMWLSNVMVRMGNPNGHDLPRIR